MPDVLMYLLDKEEANVSKMRKDLKLASGTIYAAVRRLEELGFLFRHENRVFHRQVFVGLTFRGRRMAESLRPLVEIMETTLLGMKSELQKLEFKERTEEENTRMTGILFTLIDLEFMNGRWNEAESHAKRVLDIASASGDARNVARSLKMMGEVHHRRHMVSEAEKEFQECLRIHTNLEDSGGMSDDHYFLGAIKERRGDLKGAMKEFEKSLELAESAEDDVLRGRATMGMGRVFAQEGKYRESLRMFESSIKTYEKLDETDELPRAYTCAGSSAFYLDLDESLKWHEKCIERAKDIGDVRMLAYGKSNAAGCYIEKKETKKAAQILKEAAEIAGKLGEKKLIVDISIQEGIVDGREEKWTSSEGHFSRAIELARKSNMAYELADALLNMGLMNGERGRTETAKRELKEALEVFESLDNQAKVNEIRKALRLLSQ
jgi:tetratricopeptide (TPR) repeat protein